MMNLYELGKWVQLTAEQKQVFRVENGQYVSLLARAHETSLIFVEFAPMPEDPEDEPIYDELHYLGSFLFYEEFKFWCDAGYFRLSNYFPVLGPPDGLREVFVYSGQGENWVVEPVEGESFTMVMERAPRNEEYDIMMAKMMTNVQKRMDHTMAERERAFERRIAARDAEHAAELEAFRASGEGAADGGSKVSSEADDAGSSGGGAEGSGGGKGKPNAKP